MTEFLQTEAAEGGKALHVVIPRQQLRMVPPARGLAMGVPTVWGRGQA